MNTIIANILITTGVPLLLMALGFLAAWKIKPLLDKNPKAKETAQGIATIADDISHVLVHQFPNVSWDDILAKAVDKLIDSCGLSQSTAETVALAALLRKRTDAIKTPNAIIPRALTPIIDESKTER